jgi:hypothetical protein
MFVRIINNYIVVLHYVLSVRRRAEPVAEKWLIFVGTVGNLG